MLLLAAHGETLVPSYLRHEIKLVVGVESLELNKINTLIAQYSNTVGTIFKQKKSL